MDATDSPPTDRRADPGRLAIVAGLVSCAATLLAIAAPVIARRPLMGDDLGRFHWPIRAFYSRCLADGDEPLWHTGIHCGIYIHGEGQAGMDHPLHLWLYGSLPPDVAFAIEVAIGYPVLLLGMVLWLRRLGVRSDGAILGGIVFTFSGFMLLRYVHTNAVQVVAHLPWILLAIEAMGDCGRTRRALVALGCVALLTASQGLLGYPQYLAFSILVTASYAIARLGPSGAAIVLLGIGLGVVAASGQILPQLDALATSTRSSPTLAFLGKNSLHPLNLTQAMSPLAFRAGHYRPDSPATWPRHESVAYFGAVVPALVGWLWIRRRDLGRHSPLAAWAASIGAGAIVLSLGRYSPLFPIYARLPGAGVFRAPSRYLLIAQFTAGVLAAIAFGDLAKFAIRSAPMPIRSLRPLLWPIAASLAAGLGLAVVAAIHPQGWRSEQVSAAGGLATSCLVIAAPCLLVAMAARGSRLAPAALVLIAAVDSGLYAIGPIARHEAQLPAGSRPPEHSGRVVSAWNGVSADGSRLVHGYVALTPLRRLNYTLDATLSRVQAEWRVNETGEWSRIGPALVPRARLLTTAKVSVDPAREIAEVDPETTALVDAPVALDAGSPGSASIIEERPGRILVETYGQGRRLLVISEAHHPGWTATVDGRSATPIRADGDFLGLVVGPGRRTVAFRFSPRSARLGRTIGRVGLAVTAVILVAGLLPTRGSDRSGSLTSPVGSDVIRLRRHQGWPEATSSTGNVRSVSRSRPAAVRDGPITSAGPGQAQP